jgi:hypothetical protein
MHRLGVAVLVAGLQNHVEEVLRHALAILIAAAPFAVDLAIAGLALSVVFDETRAEFQILLRRHRIGKLRDQSTYNGKTQKAQANFCSTTHAAPAQAKRDLKVPGMQRVKIDIP